MTGPSPSHPKWICYPLKVPMRDSQAFSFPLTRPPASLSPSPRVTVRAAGPHLPVSTQHSCEVSCAVLVLQRKRAGSESFNDFPEMTQVMSDSREWKSGVFDTKTHNFHLLLLSAKSVLNKNE